jgi:hypothetical protein
MFLARALMAAAGGNAYQNVILADKPVAFWPLNETRGAVAYDLSGNGYNAAYIGTPTLGAAPIAGGLGASVSLNGSAQYVELATPPAALQIVEGSFEVWANQSTVVKGAALLANDYSTTVNFAIGQGNKNNATPTTALLFGGNYEGSWDYAGYGSTLAAGSPAHVVYTNNGTTAILYLNGVAIYTGASRTFTANSAAIYIGKNWGSAFYVNGLMSNVAIYNTVLSASRILAHYNAGIA